MPLHPSLDLLRLHLITSHLKVKFILVGFYKLPFLAFPDNCLHLLRLHIFVLLPLTDARSVLPQPVAVSVSATP